MKKRKILFYLFFFTISFNSLIKYNVKAKTLNEILPSAGIWDTINHGFPQAPKQPSIAEWDICHTRAEDVINDSEEILTNLQKNRWNITLTKEEIDLLAQIVFLEAGNQGLEGQEYVVTVVFNRMYSEEFPSTVYEVLSQKNPVQFVTWKNREKSTPTEETYLAIENVLNGKANNYITNSYFKYFSLGKGNKNAVKIGDHWFW